MQTANIELNDNVLQAMISEMIRRTIAQNQMQATLICNFVLKAIGVLTDDDAATYKSTAIFMWHQLSAKIDACPVANSRQNKIDAIEIVLTQFGITIPYKWHRER